MLPCSFLSNNHEGFVDNVCIFVGKKFKCNSSRAWAATTDSKGWFNPSYRVFSYFSDNVTWTDHFQFCTFKFRLKSNFWFLFVFSNLSRKKTTKNSVDFCWIFSWFSHTWTVRMFIYCTDYSFKHLIFTSDLLLPKTVTDLQSKKSRH